MTSATTPPRKPTAAHTKPEPKSAPAPFRFRVFIFRMIAAIFLVEAAFLAASFSACRSAFEKRLPDNANPVVITDHCPGLGDRAETLFVAALSTTLGLLSAGGSDPAP